MPDSAQELERRIYVDLLGIPKEKCPPTYFALLDIAPSTDTAEAIEAAAKRRADLLRSGVPNDLHLAARQVLQRIARARVCLMDAEAKAAYIASLSSPDKSSRQPGVGPRSVNQQRVGAGSKLSGSHRSDQGSSQKPSGSAVLPRLPSGVELPPLLDESLFDELAGPGLDLGPTTIPITKRKTESHLAVYLSVAGILGAIVIVVGLVVAFSAPDEAVPQIAAGPSTTDHKVVASKPLALSAQEVKAPKSVVEIPTRQVESIGDQSHATVPNAAISAPQPSDDTASVAAEIDPKIAAATKPLPADENGNGPSPSEVKSLEEPLTLEGLVHEVALPTIRSVSKNAAEIKESDSFVELGDVNNSTSKLLQVSLNQPKSASTSPSSFYVKKADDTVPAWEVCLKSEAPKQTGTPEKSSRLAEAAIGFDEPVASLKAADGQLRFEWATPEHISFAEHLRNCVLRIRAGQLDHRLQLRQTQETNRFVTDLTQRNQLFELENHALPEGMQFQISNVNMSGVKFELEPTDGVIRPGDTLRIKLLDWDGQAELQFTFSVTKSKAIVRFTPRHKLGSRWYPFTSGDVRGSINDMSDALADARATHSAASSAVSSLPGQIRSAEASYTREDHARSLSIISDLRGRLRKAQGALRRTSRSIPELETKIPYLESLASVGRQIHQKGSLEFRVFVPLDDGELDLLKTGLEDPPQLKPAENESYE